MKKELIDSGKNFNVATDRKEFILNTPEYAKEWIKIPHYWAVDADGNIYDPAGMLQFLGSVSGDLGKARYVAD